MNTAAYHPSKPPLVALATAWHRLCHGEPVAAASPTADPLPALAGASLAPPLLAAAAVRVARCIFDDLGAQQILLVGIDPWIAPYADGFLAAHPRGFTVIGPPEGPARRLAQRIGGRAVRLPELPEQLPLHDIVVSCTASPLPILGKGMIERTIRWRRHRPLLILDLALHHDVEPEAADVDDVYVYATTDLVRLAAAHPELLRGDRVADGSALAPRSPRHS